MLGSFYIRKDTSNSSFSRAKTSRFRLQNEKFIELSGPQSVYEMNPSEKVDTSFRKHCKILNFNAIKHFLGEAWSTHNRTH